MLQNFIGLDGRIGRQSWWIGTIIMVIVALVLYFVLSAVLGTGMSAMMDPAKMTEPGFMESYMKSAAWQQVISLIVMGYPITALMSKRLNDRNRPSWLKWLFWLPTVLGALLGLAGMAYTFADAGGGLMMPTPTTLMTIVTILSVVLGLWALVELGFLRGTDGPNPHGADPTN